MLKRNISTSVMRHNESCTLENNNMNKSYPVFQGIFVSYGPELLRVWGGRGSLGPKKYTLYTQMAVH